MMEFDVGVAPFNPDGWGPLDTPVVPNLSKREGSGTLPANISFAPFSRSEKLGRIADWTHNPNFNNPAARSTGGTSPSTSHLPSPLLPPPTLPSISSTESPHRAPSLAPTGDSSSAPSFPNAATRRLKAYKCEAEKERIHRDRDSLVLKSSVNIQPEWTMLNQIDSLLYLRRCRSRRRRP